MTSPYPKFSSSKEASYQNSTRTDSLKFRNILGARNSESLKFPGYFCLGLGWVKKVSTNDLNGPIKFLFIFVLCVRVRGGEGRQSREAETQSIPHSTPLLLCQLMSMWSILLWQQPTLPPSSPKWLSSFSGPALSIISTDQLSLSWLQTQLSPQDYLQLLPIESPVTVNSKENILLNERNKSQRTTQNMITHIWSFQKMQNHHGKIWVRDESIDYKET